MGGLQVRHRDGWFEVPDVPDSFVCNVGDMLERLTRGRYLSALHRVRSSAQSDRMSMALFFDQAFDGSPQRLSRAAHRPSEEPHTLVGRAWDDLDPHAANRTYGEYLLSKVGRVFPVLREEALQASATRTGSKPTPPRMMSGMNRSLLLCSLALATVLAIGQPAPNSQQPASTPPPDTAAQRPAASLQARRTGADRRSDRALSGFAAGTSARWRSTYPLEIVLAARWSEDHPDVRAGTLSRRR